MRLSTQFLSPAEFGLLVLLVSFQLWSGLLLVNPVGQYINRNTHAWIDDGSLFRRLKVYRWYVVLAAAAGACAAGTWSFAQDAGLVTVAGRAIAVLLVVGSFTWHGTLVQ